METQINEILQRLINLKKTKNRKKKPGAKTTFINLIKKKIDSKDIVTCGVFGLLPTEIAIKINDKKEIDKLTYTELQTICKIILNNATNKKCFVYLTVSGKNNLQNIINNPELYNKKLLDLRSIFNTQERQMTLG